MPVSQPHIAALSKIYKIPVVVWAPWEYRGKKDREEAITDMNAMAPIVAGKKMELIEINGRLYGPTVTGEEYANVAPIQLLNEHQHYQFVNNQFF